MMVSDTTNPRSSLRGREREREREREIIMVNLRIISIDSLRHYWFAVSIYIDTFFFFGL